MEKKDQCASALKKDEWPQHNLEKVDDPADDVGISRTDKELFIRQTFKSDPSKGCELLFRLYYQQLCNHAVRYVYSKDIARDLVSDLFFTFLKKKLYLKITSSYRSYFFSAVRNKSLNYLRNEFYKIDSNNDVDKFDFSSPYPDPHQIVQFHELAHKIEDAIKTLPPQRQRVFLMSRYDGKKYRRIADELKISVKAVEAHISKGLDVLRKALKDNL